MSVVAALKPSLVYAAIVFAVGFVLGSVRVFVLVPRIGVRWAELLEAPLMILARFLVARFIVWRWGLIARGPCLAVGIFSLALMLLAEVGFVLVQGLNIPEYMASRDPVSGPVYLLCLGMFAAMPLLVRLGRGSNISFKADRPDGKRP